MDQLTLFQTPKRPLNRYRLFVGIFPDADAVDLICEHQLNLRDRLGLTGKPRPRSHLHVTLHKIGDYPEVPEQVVAATIKVCTSTFVNESSFEVVVDHAKSFSGRPGSNAFVLANPKGNMALLELHQRLITGLIHHRLARPKDMKFDPHVTLLYDKRIVPEQPVGPVRWTAKEVVLVLSHLGATKYERLGRWPLSE